MRTNISKADLNAALDELEYEIFENGPMGWWILGECLLCFQSPEGSCDCEDH